MASRNLAIEVENVLHAVQDFMANATNAAWPATTPLPRFDRLAATKEEAREQGEQWTSRLPLPGVAVQEGVIRLWYGDETSPALVLESIPLG